MFQLRPYQERAISELYAWMNRHIQDNKNPIVNMCVGAGKSVVIAELCKRAISEFPQTRIIMTVASRELCQQNLEKLLAIWPEAPAGVCSAALGKKDLESQIIFATIGSIAKQAIHLGRVDLIIVDECHNINTEQSGMYRKFISECERYNNGKILVIGFTGTPFRGNGVHLHDPGNEKRLFDSIATTVGMDELLKSGHLSPLVVQDDTPTLVDTSSVKVVGGDYVISDLDDLMNDDFVIEQATSDIILKGATRKKWLTFCVTVEHAENVLASFIKKGINANMITSKTPKAERQAIINQFKKGDLQCLVNIATLTTGFDAPETDLIALLRPTKSPVLYVQIAGRGMRIADGKENCLWLDYTETTVEQGPVNKITGRKGFKSKPSEAPTRECPECQNYMPISFKECSECGYIFPIEEKPKHDTRSGTADILTGIKPPVKEWFDVSDVSYAKHTKRETGANSLRVSYHIGDIGPVISEWIALESQSQFARKQANAWWLKRYVPAVDFDCIPETVADAINASELLMTPKRILAQKEGKYWKVINYEFS